MADKNAPEEKTAWSGVRKIEKSSSSDKNGGTESTDTSDDPTKSEQLPMGEFRKNEGQGPGGIDQKPAAMRAPPDDYDSDEAGADTEETSGPRGSDDKRDWADRSPKEREKLQRG